ncbi:MAG: protein-disulfide isomerase [Acidocella sp. 20-57-95]|nr:MAG: protein-disulfide isomerase [Acidocella sp. 20-57-95]HQT65823.1 DsbA family protein [Acidocella sp.]
MTNQPHLVYFADPMCSWCWGFSPVVSAIRAEFGDQLPVRLVLGGLRPGTITPMDEAAKASTRSHWEHVHAASGQRFDHKFFDRLNFIYDTEPACRAVVLARRHSMNMALDMLAAIHQAFYAENQDVTTPDVLAYIFASLGGDEAMFRAEFSDAALLQETQQDFYISQQTGVTGFPTLIAGSHADAPFDLVTQGFQTAAHILPALKDWLRRQEKREGHE